MAVPLTVLHFTVIGSLTESSGRQRHRERRVAGALGDDAAARDVERERRIVVFDGDGGGRR